MSLSASCSWVGEWVNGHHTVNEVIFVCGRSGFPFAKLDCSLSIPLCDPGISSIPWPRASCAEQEFLNQHNAERLRGYFWKPGVIFHSPHT